VRQITWPLGQEISDCAACDNPPARCEKRKDVMLAILQNAAAFAIGAGIVIRLDCQRAATLAALASKQHPLNLHKPRVDTARTVR
jgi:hypothetical protein